MIDDIFIFDNVIHRIDMSDENQRDDRDDTESAVENILRTGKLFLAPQYHGDNFEKRFTIEEMYKMVFVDAPTDMAMVQVVPQWDWFTDWYAPVQLQYELAAAYPDRIVFCGGVDPLYRGLEDALEQIEYQVTELGAVSMKFYNGHVPTSWRCDDEKVAYPLYEKCRELGVKVVQFHKGVPFGLGHVEDLSPVDLQDPARDFPDMVFVIHHLAIPYVDECINIASRYPNVYLALSGNLNLALIAPRLVQQWLGQCLMFVGPDKLLWGSEAALSGGPLPYIKAFLELEIPEDMRIGFGYPQISREDKEKILGLNFAKLMGIDIDDKKRELGLAPVTA